MPGLVGRRITGVHDLATGAIRQAVTDDADKPHLFEFWNAGSRQSVGVGRAASPQDDALVALGL